MVVLRFAQFREYLQRAEYLKSVIDGQVPAVQTSNGTGQKAKPGGGNGGGGDKEAVGLCSVLLWADVRPENFS